MILQQLLSRPLYGLIFAIVIVASLSFHEFAHAYMGFLQGDDTAKRAGRLSLDPRVHLDLMGTLTFLLAGIGWAKPVPFNPYNLRNQKWGPTFVAAAGPLANLFLVVISAIFLHLIIAFASFGSGNALVVFLATMIRLNLLLFVFNLIPVPPLDGSKFLIDVLRRNPNNNRLVFLLETRGSFYLIMFILIDSFLLNGLIFGTFFDVISRGILRLLGF